MVWWREVLLLGVTWLVPTVLGAAPLVWSGQDAPWPKSSLIHCATPVTLRHGDHYYVCVCGLNPKRFKCQGWLYHRLLCWYLRDGHVICPLGQAGWLQSLLGHCWSLSWEGRAGYNGICGHNICLHCSSITCAQISSGREMIDLLQKEWTATQALQKAAETSWGERKDNPSSNLYLNCTLGSNPHSKREHWSLLLLWLWATQRALKKYKLSHTIATPSDQSLQKKRAKPNGPCPCPVMPIPECFLRLILPHVGTGLSNTLFPTLKTYGPLLKPAAFCLCAVQNVVIWCTRGWHLQTLSPPLTLISGDQALQ